MKFINQGRFEILIMAYSFNSMPLAQALIDASKRSVKVEILMDKSERPEGFTPAVLMANTGIPVWFDGTHAVMNNRVFIIGTKIVITGSFNLNSASENMNAENLLILQSPEMAKLYRENWFNHQRHSEKYKSQIGRRGAS